MVVVVVVVVVVVMVVVMYSGIGSDIDRGSDSVVYSGSVQW